MTTLMLERRELDYLYKRREEQFRPKKFRQYMQIETAVPAWADRVEVQKLSLYGSVRPTVHGGSDQPPVPTLQRENNFLVVYEFEAAYGYRDDEIERARQAGVQLSAKLPAANKEAAEQTLETIASVGYTGPTIPGIANNADAVTNKVTSGENWTDSTDPSTILDKLHTTCDSVEQESKEIFTADTLMLPMTSYKFISRKRIGDGTTDTILSAFLKESASVRRVVPWYKLETAGTGGIKRAVAFDASKDESPKLIIPRELTDHPQVREMFGIKIGQTMRTAGVLIENYRALRYLDGI